MLIFKYLTSKYLEFCTLRLDEDITWPQPGRDTPEEARCSRRRLTPPPYIRGNVQGSANVCLPPNATPMRIQKEGEHVARLPVGKSYGQFYRFFFWCGLTSCALANFLFPSDFCLICLLQCGPHQDGVQIKIQDEAVLGFQISRHKQAHNLMVFT